MTIRKKAFFLPQYVLEQSASLIDEMLIADAIFECIDTPQLPNFIDEFYEMRMEQYREYIKVHEIDQEKLTPDDIWIELINEQAEKRFDKLDIIFEDYLWFSL